MSLLVCRANVGHDFPIISGTFLCSEASGYFGLDLYHPKITFCLVVIKRDIEVMNKKADWDLVIRKAFYKGKDFSFFLPTTFFLCGFGKWIFLPSLFDKFIILFSELMIVIIAQKVLAFLYSFVFDLFHFQ